MCLESTFFFPELADFGKNKKHIIFVLSGLINSHSIMRHKAAAVME